MAVIAVYELPVPVWMSTAVLDRTFRTGYRSVEFDVVMPGGGGPAGSPPEVEGVDWSHVGLTDSSGAPGESAWAQRYGAFTPGADEDSTAVCRVVFTDVVDSSPPRHYPSGPEDALAGAVDGWFDAVRTWVETRTGQDLDPGHRIYDAVMHGVGLTFIEPQLEHTGLSMTLTTPRIIPLSARDWAMIVESVREGLEPPLEEVLSRDARAAHTRGHYRRAIVDAATALEIALYRVIKAEVNPDVLSARLRGQLKSPKPPTLGACLTIAEQAGLAFEVPFNDLKQLNDLRIAAVHHGSAAGSRVTAHAVQTMIDFLGAHGLWRRSKEREPDGSEWVLATDTETEGGDSAAVDA